MSIFWRKYRSKSNSSSRYNRKTPSVVNFNVYDSKSSDLTNSQEQESQESQLKQAAEQVIDKSANNTRCRTKDSKAGFLHSTAEDKRRSKYGELIILIELNFQRDMTDIATLMEML